MNNIIKDRKEKIRGLIKKIDGFILKKKNWCECGRGYVHILDYNRHKKNCNISKH